MHTQKSFISASRRGDGMQKAGALGRGTAAKKAALEWNYGRGLMRQVMKSMSAFLVDTGYKTDLFQGICQMDYFDAIPVWPILCLAQFH